MVQYRANNLANDAADDNAGPNHELHILKSTTRSYFCVLGSYLVNAPFVGTEGTDTAGDL